MAAAMTASVALLSSAPANGAATGDSAAAGSSSVRAGGAALLSSLSEFARGSSPCRRSSPLPSALGRLPSAARRASLPLVSDGVALPVLDSCDSRCNSYSQRHTFKRCVSC